MSGKTYLAELPGGYEGEFGPGIKALVISLYYGSNMTQGKLLDFLGDLGISMSAGYLSNLLIKNHEDFQTEKIQNYCEGIASSPWQHLNQTSARVSGVNYTTNMICNPLYTVYFTTPKKDRLTALKGLQNTNVLEVILNQFTYELLDTFQIPQKFQSSLKLLPQEKVLNEVEFNTLLSLVATTRKLGISFFEYVRDRICELGQIGRLAQFIREKAITLQLGYSWNDSFLLSPNY